MWWRLDFTGTSVARLLYRCRVDSLAALAAALVREPSFLQEEIQLWLQKGPAAKKAFQRVWPKVLAEATSLSESVKKTVGVKRPASASRAGSADMIPRSLSSGSSKRRPFAG